MNNNLLTRVRTAARKAAPSIAIFLAIVAVALAFLVTQIYFTIGL